MYLKWTFIKYQKLGQNTKRQELHNYHHYLHMITVPQECQSCCKPPTLTRHQATRWHLGYPQVCLHLIYTLCWLSGLRIQGEGVEKDVGGMEGAHRRGWVTDRRSLSKVDEGSLSDRVSLRGWIGRAFNICWFFSWTSEILLCVANYFIWLKVKNKDAVFVQLKSQHWSPLLPLFHVQ